MCISSITCSTVQVIKTSRESCLCYTTPSYIYYHHPIDPDLLVPSSHSTLRAQRVLYQTIVITFVNVRTATHVCNPMTRTPIPFPQ